jgi:formimidoylglutamate deiminase
MRSIYRPDLLYKGGTFHTGLDLSVSESGELTATSAVDIPQTKIVALKDKAVIPGFVNVHSHSFQRLIRGKSESRVTSGNDFWSWRGTMYHAAAHLTPQDVYDVARMAFLEMVQAGTTTVGEFHYLHTDPDGRPYDDPNLLSKQVIAAARSVGIRIVLLRSAYLRSGYELPPDPGQTRFRENASAFLHNSEELIHEFDSDREGVRFGIAPHSIRAVPLDTLHQIADWARERHLPLHMHVSEQIAENQACLREYGSTPVALLEREGLLGADFTAIHAIHITDEEIAMLADAKTIICSCPTTERNLGDGILAADKIMQAKIRVALGSDSQAQIDPLEDARELDYHLRLNQQQRAILDQIYEESLSARLFDCATLNGARALNVPAGALSAGLSADFVTLDRNDPSIAGHSAEDLLPMLTFGLNRSAIRDVFVNGRQILRDGRHALEEEIVAKYKEVHQRIWACPPDRGRHP